MKIKYENTLTISHLFWYKKSFASIYHAIVNYIKTVDVLLEEENEVR